MTEELRAILTRFASCGWDAIDGMSRDYLDGKCSREQLIAALQQADDECGTCGCEFDPLYKRALAILRGE